LDKDLFGTCKPSSPCATCKLCRRSRVRQSFGDEAGVEKARADLLALQDGVWMRSCSRTNLAAYLTKVEAVTVAAMARVIGELSKEIRIPFGVNVLWDPGAPLDLAVAVGAKFVREISRGYTPVILVYGTPLWCDCAAPAPYRR